MQNGHFGDSGKTKLASVTPIGKDDVRVEALGALEELTALLRLSALAGNGPHCPTLARLLRVLSHLSDYIRTGGEAKHLPTREELTFLEEGITKLTPPAECGVALTEESARLYHAAAVARRCERALVRCSRIYPMREPSVAYLNRLSDWLCALAKNADYRTACGEGEAESGTAGGAIDTEALVGAVLRELGVRPMLDLSVAKRLIEAVEERAKAEGRRVVVAVANAEGNPIAVHVMDGAYLVSFDVAVRKAYTAVAVRMPTRELFDLVARGGTFQGLDRLENLVTFGGGIPLFSGDTLLGAIAVSGGTGDEDHALAEYARQVFEGM
ncbi:MAG: ATP:cob(I)alamin adenosyltransferase [Clostridia bacterium]|nr:ATP:cob(I)alamin adenosyltransferase [Clostridia bacterium]